MGWSKWMLYRRDVPLSRHRTRPQGIRALEPLILRSGAVTVALAVERGGSLALDLGAALDAATAPVRVRKPPGMAAGAEGRGLR